MKIEDAKSKLDTHIQKQRTHMYKPIQIAEILMKIRENKAGIVAEDSMTYRTQSKRWRDDVTSELIGRKCTSSARFQDDLFNPNAMPPEVIKTLAEENIKKNGIVECYIYTRFKQRLDNVHVIKKYLDESTIETFQLEAFLEFFYKQQGLKRSIDKAYEIIVYALFYSILEHLKIKVELSIENPDIELIKTFEEFTKKVMKIDSTNISTTKYANIYRVGVTNAADKGLDMWTNFGPVIQVKHLTLTEELAESVADSITADEIVIVCKNAEENIISNLFSQLGWQEKIQAVITEKDLIEWYNLAFNQYRLTLGGKLLNNLKVAFVQEFPSTKSLDDFFYRRGYDETSLNGIWSK